MDIEAMQLLNLSPIPELSELELSTMLEQLSGLSDINGDLTDRNVEDIIKEAEDLLDKSKSSDVNISESIKSPEAKEDKLEVVSKNVTVLKDNQGPDIQMMDSNKSKDKSLDKIDHPVPQNSPVEGNNSIKHSNSTAEMASTRMFSPGASCNPIKSAIDSLNEFSTIVEKKLNQSPKSSAKQTKPSNQGEKESQNKSNSQLNEKSISSKQNKGKPVKTDDAPEKNAPETFTEKSVKLLNCFERLYRDRPLRFIPSRKPKIADKIPKAIVKKRVPKELKNTKKINRQGKTAKKNTVEETTNNSVNAKDYFLPETIFLDGDPLTEIKEEKFFPSNSAQKQNTVNSTGNEHDASHGCLMHLSQSHCGDHLRSPPTKIDERLILRVLEEMKEIKDQVRKVGVFSNTHGQGGVKKENPKTELSEIVGGFDLMKNSGIKRLEEQVTSLKEKYDHQMEKLEAENSRLREALSGKFITPQVFCVPKDVVQAEQKTYRASLSNSSPTSRESMFCKTPQNTPVHSPELTKTVSKEACSQTEKHVKSASSQCCQEIPAKKAEEKTEKQGETKEIENKENVAIKKKPTKWKPFSDINIHHLMKQKKMFDHEAQLLATVRGLQAEMANKEKEYRKLKAEADSLRRQVNKWTSLKVETCKRCHIGTQTIGLGPAVQKPYNPENYEAAGDLQRENEELRLRIKTIEEDLETLKEKRINDLQELHHVHEEEMAKVVSKLETQSALTKHLHSLLVNR